MNRYHREHPDPEIRAKYANWDMAYTKYVNRGGKLTAQQKEEARKNESEETKEKKKKSVLMTALRKLAGAAGFKARQKATGKKSNIRKSGGQRGS